MNAGMQQTYYLRVMRQRKLRYNTADPDSFKFLRPQNNAEYFPLHADISVIPSRVVNACSSSRTLQ